MLALTLHIGRQGMIELYFWTTDNGYKARHMMEESGLDYVIKPINIRENEQFDPEYLKISPNHKLPAIIDHDGTRKGLDLELINKIKKTDINVPLIFSGGIGNIRHVEELKKIFPEEALALGSALHYKRKKKAFIIFAQYLA